MPNSFKPIDNANVIATAPVFYATTFILGLVANYFYPIPLMIKNHALITGIVLIAVSIPIVLSAIYELRKSGTAFDAR